MVSVFERSSYHPVQAFRLKVVCPNRCVLRRFFFILVAKKWKKIEKFLDLARRLKTCRAHGRVRYIPTKGNYKIFPWPPPFFSSLDPTDNFKIPVTLNKRLAQMAVRQCAKSFCCHLRRGGCYSPLCHLLKPNRLHICNKNLYFMTTAYVDRNNQVIKSVSFTTNRS